MHFLTQSPLLKALGWALFDSLWQMALLWLLYSMLAFIFRPVAAGIRHGLALMLVSLGTFWSAASFIAACCRPHPNHWTTGSWLNLPGLNLLPAPSRAWLWQVNRCFTDVILVDGSSIYLLVLGGLLVRYAYHYRQSRQLTRRGLSKLPSGLRVFVSATSSRLGIRPAVSAWLSSQVDVPLTLGHLKPVILLPVAMVNHLTTRQVEAILVHELAHIRRHDYLLQLIVTVLEGIFFFNPFARLLIRQVKKERENCCDDLVLQFQYDRHSYVSALLSLATHSRLTARRPPVNTAIAATGDGNQLLLQRAKRILQQKQSHDSPGIRPLILLLFTGLITLITVYRPARTVVSRQPLPVAIAAPRPFLQVKVPVRVDAAEISSAMSLPRAKDRTVHAGRRTTADDIDVNIDDGPDADDRQPEDNTITFINTADETPAGGANPDDPEQTALPDQSVQSDPSVQADQDAAPREYSIRLTCPSAPVSLQRPGTPFVPNSSFSYLFTTADSTHAAEQLFYLQESTRAEIFTAMATLHRQFEEQMRTLTAQELRARESLPMHRQLRSRELQLQQLYLKKIMDWEKRLEKASHLKKIADI